VRYRTISYDIALNKSANDEGSAATAATAAAAATATATAAAAAAAAVAATTPIAAAWAAPAAACAAGGIRAAAYTAGPTFRRFYAAASGCVGNGRSEVGTSRAGGEKAMDGLDNTSAVATAVDPAGGFDSLRKTWRDPVVLLFRRERRDHDGGKGECRRENLLVHGYLVRAESRYLTVQLVKRLLQACVRLEQSRKNRICAKVSRCRSLD
jgi:hypothetical protein